jgi:hypothetical protein
MKYYQINKGQISNTWISAQTFTMDWNDNPVIDNGFITIEPGEEINLNICVSAPWKKDLEKTGLQFTKL